MSCKPQLSATHSSIKGPFRALKEGLTQAGFEPAIF